MEIALLLTCIVGASWTAYGYGYTRGSDDKSDGKTLSQMINDRKKNHSFATDK